MTHPGFRSPLYISGGFTFYRKPLLSPVFMPAEESIRTKNGKLRTWSLQPKAGWPTVLKKLRLVLTWGQMASTDIQAANDIVAIRGPFDICYWKEVSESFYIAAGDPLEGFLQRPSALDVVAPLPARAATLYPVSGRRGDGSAMTVTLGTPDADGVTPWSATGTSSGEHVVVRRTPVFRMRVVEEQLAFPQPQVDSQTLTLEEA